MQTVNLIFEIGTLLLGSVSGILTIKEKAKGNTQDAIWLMLIAIITLLALN